MQHRLTPPRRTKGAREVGAGYDTWGDGREASTPYQTRVPPATPDIRTNFTPAIPRTRGVEDAAPYGRVRDVGIGIAVSRCANAANLCPPLGSPERGAVAALRAVTEGLVQRGYNADAHRRGGLPRPPGVGKRITAAHRGRCALRRAEKCQRKTGVVRHPEEGAASSVHRGCGIAGVG